MPRRELLVRVADVVEDLMIATGKGTTKTDRELWWACKPLWLLLQRELKKGSDPE